MLSKRNFLMMFTMIVVVLVLFLSSVAMREYMNDYDVNHAALVDLIGKGTDAAEHPEQPENPDFIASEKRTVLYLGSKDSGYDRAFSEWAGYRKKTLVRLSDTDWLDSVVPENAASEACLLIDGLSLDQNTAFAVERLTQYTENGGVVIFYRLPSYQVIAESERLQVLLGIQKLRGESVALNEIWLFGGFLLGGETHYAADGSSDTQFPDMVYEAPWYDISSRTKTYMVGMLSDAEKQAQNLNNEDMPALIWRSKCIGGGSVFAVNGDFMMGETALGILDAMLYEAQDYTIYTVVNAQNLTLAGFPDLTNENETVQEGIYGRTTQQLCRDVLWPTLVASTHESKWLATVFFSVKQKDWSEKEPNQGDLIEYLKFFNEENAEAGVSIGRMESVDLRASVEDESDTLKRWNLRYTFSSGYIRNENRQQLSSLLDSDGQMAFFGDIRTVVGEYREDCQILSWLTDKITLQNTTADAYRHSDMDSLKLKSVETALGYSNIMVDLYRVLWPEETSQQWEIVGERMASNINTFWKPFSAFEKTTITQSDARVRDFLNGSAESCRTENQIRIRTTGYTGNAYVLFRTHGEKIESITGGTWETVEDDTYLLCLTEAEAVITLKPQGMHFYKE